jgi:hypothetical protein
MPKTVVATALAVCAALSLPSIAGAQNKRGPSTAPERQQMLDTIHAWQADPLGSQTKDQVRTVLKWFSDVPDLTVHVCILLDKLPKGDKKDSTIVFSAEFMGQAAFVLEHPDNADQAAEYQAGVESALRTYEQLVKANPKDRQPYLDDLVQKRDAGALAAFVKERAASCSK